MVYDFNSPYAIIINTDAYAGNFERDMCAFVTGSYGECGVGSELAELFHEEEGQDTFLSGITDSVSDGSCYRPCSMFNDDDSNQSVIIFLTDQPEPHEWDMIVRRVQKFGAERPDLKDRSWIRPDQIKPLQIKGIRLISNEVVRKQTTLKEAVL